MDYEKLFKKAHAYAKKFLGSEAEDFAQHYCMQCFEKGKELSYKFVFMDYCDSLRANKRVLSSLANNYVSKNLLMSVETEIAEGFTIGDTLQSAPVETNEDEELLKNLELILSDREIFIYNSYIVDEKTLKEIGNDLGLTESRVSQLFKNIKDKLFAVFFIENLNIKNTIKDEIYNVWEK